MSERPHNPCRIPDCDRPIHASKLCRLHWERTRRGAPLVSTPQIGAPPYGKWGELTVLADGSVLCHECGKGWKSLGRHVTNSHYMTPREYKIAYGLPVTKGLLAPEVREAKRDALLANPERRVTGVPGATIGTQNWGVHRQSARLRDKRQSAQGTRRKLLTPDERTCPDCGAQWCPMPSARLKSGGTSGCGSDGCASRQRMKKALLTTAQRNARNQRIIDHANRGMSRRQIADRFNLTPEAVGKIIRADTRKSAPPQP